MRIRSSACNSTPGAEIPWPGGRGIDGSRGLCLCRERRHGRRGCGRVRQPDHGGQGDAVPACCLQALSAGSRGGICRYFHRAVSRDPQGDLVPVLGRPGLRGHGRKRSPSRGSRRAGCTLPTSATAACIISRPATAGSSSSPMTTPMSGGFSGRARSASGRRSSTRAARRCKRLWERATSSSTPGRCRGLPAGRHLRPVQRRRGGRVV